MGEDFVVTAQVCGAASPESVCSMMETAARGPGRSPGGVEPERAVSEWRCCLRAERHRLLVEWNATAREYPRTSGVHEVFEARRGELRTRWRRCTARSE